MKISVITVNYNNCDGLLKTIKSIINQSYRDIDFIVIDGGSTDDSLSLLKKYQNDINYWVSENDKGIYDAMNKGILASSGDYIIFMNSGDSFYNESVLEDFISLHPIEDIVYGDIFINYLNGRKKVKRMLKKLTIGNSYNFTITHQAIFHKASLFKEKYYSVDYKLISDWIFYNEAIFLGNASYKYIDLIIANYESGGLSSNIKTAENERKKYLEETQSKLFFQLLKEFNKIHLINERLQNILLIKLYLRLIKLIKRFL